MILEFEISKPFQAKPGRYRSRVQRRWWWGWWAFAITKGDARSRRRYTWEDQ